MDEALDAAIGMFWTKGYKATSMADLMEATGLHKGSIYKAFDDKHDLFVKSLTRYLQEGYRQTHAALSNADTPLDGLRAWLHIFALMCCDQPVQRGCLAMNTAVELGPHDPEIRALLQRHHASTSGLLIDTIERGQQSGQIRCDLTPDNLAKALFRSVPAFLAPPKSCATRSTPTRS
jgi:TetR/AcrR family transcriptional repressor of nem operon